jgi:hypothetical protein
MTTIRHDPRPTTIVHMAPWLDDYASGRLNPEYEEALETHLLVCDACFAAYVALFVRPS